MNAIDKELLTVQEFAEIVGIKKQGIYQQIRNANSKLFPYVVFEGKRAYIKKTALEEVYKKSQGSQAQSQEGSQDSQAQSQDGGQDSQAKNIIEFLQEQIREKDREIQEKNRQLAEKDNQINKLIELANHAQLLHAATKREQLEEAATQPEPTPEPVIDTAPIEEKPIETKKKRSFWAWLFGE